MHDRELFEKAFSPLHASPDTLTEVRKTMRNEKKHAGRWAKAPWSPLPPR